MAAAAGGLALVLLLEALRPRGPKAVLVDWDQVAERTRHRLPAEPGLTSAQRTRLAAHYNRLAAELRSPLLETVGGLPRGAELPDFVALDREGWLDLNLEILGRALDPLLEATSLPLSLVTEVGRAGLERYVALLLAFLGTRVLGQYDAQLLGKEPLLEGPGLYLVEPNILHWELEAHLPSEDLRRWLILHELTHAWQFAAHPWLREHMNSALEGVLAAARDQTRHPLRRVVGLTVGLPGQWSAIRQMQATMSLVEGYGNLVMNLVGRRLLPSFEQLESAYQKRSAQRGVLELVFWRLTGLELKLQQYRQGETFCRAVHEAHGMAALNLAWDSAGNLPRPEELRQPEAWYARVTRAGAHLRIAPA